MENKNIGIVGLISLLTVFGGSIILTQEQLDNSFYCTASEEFGIFYGGISNTGLTAYPYSENRSNYIRCQNSGIKGTWISLEDYANELGISPEEFLMQPKSEPSNKEITINYPNGNSYECMFSEEVTDNSISSNIKCSLKEV